MRGLGQGIITSCYDHGFLLFCNASNLFLFQSKVVHCQNLVKNTFANLYIQFISPESQVCGALARKLHLFVNFVPARLFFCPLITVKLILNESIGKP